MVSSGAETSASLWLDLNLCCRVGHKEQILSFRFVMTGRHKDFSFSTLEDFLSCAGAKQPDHLFTLLFVFAQRLSASYKLYVLGIP